MAHSLSSVDFFCCRAPIREERGRREDGEREVGVLRGILHREEEEARQRLARIRHVLAGHHTAAGGWSGG